jgi:CRISPR-associated protein Cmr2
MNNKKYLAITIGPIYKTMQMARKTREFWAASIMFSLLAKELCLQLLKKGCKEEDFLVPSKNIFGRKLLNVGLYLDRIICELPANLKFEDIEEDIIIPALKELTAIFNTVTLSNGNHLDFTEKELKQYFNIYAVCKEVEDNCPLEKISPPLNVLELFDNTISDSSSVDYKIKDFIENVNTEYDDDNKAIQSTFLETYYDLRDFNYNIRIPSIVEISTMALRYKPTLEQKPHYKEILNKTIWKAKPLENELFIKLKESYGEFLHNHHKYFCVIQADGDKLGTTLLKANAASVAGISTDLIQWGENALKLLTDYGALPIYIGGDDLFCFAPVNNNTESGISKKQNILDFVNMLNESYNNMPSLKGKSTLSIAVKLVYYKSPMYKAYSDTYTLLHKAKAAPNANSCCLSFDKHSGQPHEFIYSFDGNYETYIKPIADAMQFDSKEKSFLTSVMYKLRDNEELISTISKDGVRLWAFFQNNFDEAKENKKDTDKYKYLLAIKEYTIFLFEKYGVQKEELPNKNAASLYLATINLYSVLKTIRFIKGLDNDSE